MVEEKNELKNKDRLSWGFVCTIFSIVLGLFFFGALGFGMAFGGGR